MPEVAAAGVALNLTAASHVFLMDPWCATAMFLAVVVCCAFRDTQRYMKQPVSTLSVDIFPIAGGTRQSSSRRRTGSTAWVSNSTLSPLEIPWMRPRGQQHAAHPAGLDPAKASVSPALTSQLWCAAGQYKPIHAVRFIIGGTIEERILKLQDKKRAVFEGTVGKDASALVSVLARPSAVVHCCACSAHATSAC